MGNPSRARRRFAAAMALYLVWVAALAGMAVTTSKRPPRQLLPPAATEDARPPMPSRP